jgi:LCP family protein required for cell wall assembly
VPPRTSNILLLGNDDEDMGNGVSRTDAIIIAAINRDTNTATLLSLPRDLYVYMPGWTMNRINTAVTVGGVGMLKEAILYNFGIPIHYHARIDFDSFVQIVDAVGGVDIAVSCALEDWRLKAPGLDIQEEENYERFRLEPGIHHMDGDLALWYARSRRSTDDFDRGRRQQQLLRAMFEQGVDAGLVLKVPELWGIYRESVETDIDIGRLLQFAAAAPAIRQNGIQNLYLPEARLQSLVIQTAEGPIQVQVPLEETISDVSRRLYRPPALNRATRTLTVGIINSSGNPEMARLAAENLAWHGFVPVISEEAAPLVDLTTLTFHADNLRGSWDWLITWIFDLRRPGHRGNGAYQGDGQYGIDLDPTADVSWNYTVVLGKDYDPCRPEVYAPLPFLGEELGGGDWGLGIQALRALSAGCTGVEASAGSAAIFRLQARAMQGKIGRNRSEQSQIGNCRLPPRYSMHHRLEIGG